MGDKLVPKNNERAPLFYLHEFEWGNYLRSFTSVIQECTVLLICDRGQQA